MQKRTAAALSLMVLLLVATGCQNAGLRVLSLVGLSKEPLAVALVAENESTPVLSTVRVLNPLQQLDPFQPYEGWRRELERSVGRPVGIEMCFPFQVEPGLAGGWYDVAVITPGTYALFKERSAARVLGVPLDSEQRVARSALLIVRSDSPVQSVEQVRGRVVAFGPSGDARTHYAALLLLESHGLRPADLQLELLPVPGSLKHMPHDLGVLQTVMHGSSGAGFVDEGAWEQLPQTETQPGEPHREAFRVVGRTIELPRRLVVASPKLDDATAAQVRTFLLSAHAKPEVLRPLNAAGYEAPSPELLANCAALEAVVRSGRAQPATAPAGMEDE